MEQENIRQYEVPSRHDDTPKQKGFSVRNAPWSDGKISPTNGETYTPDTASTSDFPEFGSSAKKATGVAWGPSVKKFYTS